MKTCDALIVGAGSVGQPLAWELARRGWKVVVAEAAHSSGRGQNRAAIGGIRATHSDPAKIRICKLSLEKVQALEHTHGFDVDWLQGGYLFPVYDDLRETRLKTLLVQQQAAGLGIDWVPADRVLELAPGIIADGLRGGTFSPGDGSASPLKVALAYTRLCMDAGVETLWDCRVTGFVVDGGRVTTVRTTAGDVAPGVVVDASGASARDLGALLGLDVPVYNDSHEGGITEPVRRFFQPMIVDIRGGPGSANYYFYQNREGQVVFCITPDPRILGTNCDNTSTFLPQVIGRMVSLYPRLRNLRVRRTWRGLYPMTPDGFPIVGRPRDVANVWLAVGMCGQGFMLGPGLGEILARILVDGTHAYDAILDQLSLYRDFGGVEMLK